MVRVPRRRVEHGLVACTNLLLVLLHVSFGMYDRIRDYCTDDFAPFVSVFCVFLFC